MSIAILPMAAEYKWNAATVGLVQSSFFWGYLLTQVNKLLSLFMKFNLTVLDTYQDTCLCSKNFANRLFFVVKGRQSL